MASLNAWRSLRTAWRYHLQAQRDIVEASRAAASGQQATLVELRSNLTPQQAALDELRSTLGAQQATLEELRSTLSAQQATLEMLRSATGATEQLVQVSLRQQYRDLVHRGGPLPDFADVEFRCNSQNGEDGILLHIFALIGTTNRTVLEICAGDGIECNAANLILNHGFRGLLFDGNTSLVERGRAFYASHPNTRISPPQHIAAWITAETINELVATHGFTGDIDLLSLDLDGNDYWIWKALTIVRPRVVVMEFNGGCGPDVAATMSYKPDYQWAYVPGAPTRCGASLSAFVKLGRSKGYRLVGMQRLNFNAFFVREDIGTRALPEVTPEQLYARHGAVDWNAAAKVIMGGSEPWERV